MKTSLKKLVAGASIVALVAMNVALTNAAGVALSVSSADRQAITINLPAGVDLEAADTMNLYIKNATTGVAIDLSGNQVTSAKLGVGANETLTNAGDANGAILLTESGDNEADGVDLLINLTAPLATDTAYSISYLDSDGNFGTANINFGTANTVVVSASVIPVLSMALVGGTLTLGDLAIDTNKSSSDEVNITVKTNAKLGAVVTATSTNGGLNSASAVYTIDEDNANTEFYGLAINAATMGASTNQAPTNAFNNAGSNAITIATTDGAPTTNAGVTRYVKATATVDDNTPAAGDYTDTLTFTVVGTF